MRAAQKGYASGLAVEPSKLTVGAYLEQWLAMTRMRRGDLLKLHWRWACPPTACTT